MCIDCGMDFDEREFAGARLSRLNDWIILE